MKGIYVKNTTGNERERSRVNRLNRKSWLEKDMGSHEYRLAKALLLEEERLQNEEPGSILSKSPIFKDEETGRTLIRGNIYLLGEKRVRFLGYANLENGLTQFKIQYLDNNQNEEWIPSWYIDRMIEYSESTQEAEKKVPIRSLLIYKIRDIFRK